MTANDVRDLVERLLMWGGRRLDLSHPFVDARLPDGSRLHVAIPDVTATHWAVNIRKHLIRGKSLQELANLGVMTQAIALYLERAVQAGLNIMVSGSTQAGKTTLLNALVSAGTLNNRVITIEEVFEMWCHAKHHPVKDNFHEKQICEFVRYYLETEKEAINS